MAIVFKTYNNRHQLHVIGETWVVGSKQQMDEVLGLFAKSEIAKITVQIVTEKINLTFNGAIVECRDISDVKRKFLVLADLKERFQKIEAVKKTKKKVSK